MARRNCAEEPVRLTATPFERPQAVRKTGVGRLPAASVQLDAERLDDRRPKRDIRRQLIPKLLGVRIDNRLYAGIDQHLLPGSVGHCSMGSIHDILNDRTWSARWCDEANRASYSKLRITRLRR